jgi:hypothetical protein
MPPGDNGPADGTREVNGTDGSLDTARPAAYRGRARGIQKTREASMNRAGGSLTAAVAAVVAMTMVCGVLAGPVPGKALVVSAGDQARANVPMSIDAPADAKAATMTCGGKPVPCQVAGGRLYWILDELAAGATKTYEVAFGSAAPADAGGVAVTADAETVAFAIDGRPFTVYRFSNPKIAGQQLKRPFFWPVLGPGQTPMTRPWPCTDEPVDANVTKDHPHHTSLWVAYGEVSGVDNWSIAEKAGWQLHKAFAGVCSGPVFGAFTETLDWTDAAKKPNMAETRTVRIWRMPQDARLLDLEVTLTAAYGPVEFGDTKEGGVCSTRMRTEFQADKKGAEGRLVNSAGQTGDATWGKKAAWVDASGMVDGKRLGYATFDAPDNPDSPCRWHSRTYGLLSTNPFAVASFEKGAAKRVVQIEPGKSLTFRYRLYFHAGDEKEAGVAAKYADYASPPKAEWK